MTGFSAPGARRRRAANGGIAATADRCTVHRHQHTLASTLIVRPRPVCCGCEGRRRGDARPRRAAATASWHIAARYCS
jgi:hypothetical protein